MDYCCFGVPRPAACVAAGLSCDNGRRDDHDLLNLRWADAASSRGQNQAHLYQSEAVFLNRFKKSIGHKQP